MKGPGPEAGAVGERKVGADEVLGPKKGHIAYVERPGAADHLNERVAAIECLGTDHDPSAAELHLQKRIAILERMVVEHEPLSAGGEIYARQVGVVEGSFSHGRHIGSDCDRQARQKLTFAVSVLGHVSVDRENAVYCRRRIQEAFAAAGASERAVRAAVLVVGPGTCIITRRARLRHSQHEQARASHCSFHSGRRAKVS